jgi:hypothetical protein
VRARFVALFLLGIVAFNPPILAIFDADRLVLGLPLVYLYIFVAWAVLIALARLAAAERGIETGGPIEPEAEG